MSAISNQKRTRTPPETGEDYGHDVPSNVPRGELFAQLIRDGRSRAGISQDALADRAGVNRSTVIRWESGDASRPDPDQVRAVCRVLDIDPIRAGIALGYVDPARLGSAAGAPILDPEVREALELLQDPALPAAERTAWIEYLRYLRQQAAARRRSG